MTMRLIAIILLTIHIGGCATRAPTVSEMPEPASIASPAATLNAIPTASRDAAPAVQPEILIALNLANAVSQLEALPPVQTTIDLLESDRGDFFTTAMRAALQQAGYGIRWIQSNASPSLFQYRKESESGVASTTRDTYEIAIGSVEMRRGYATDGQQRVQPVTPLYLRGADVSGIALNDDIFNNNGTLDIPATGEELNVAGNDSRTSKDQRVSAPAKITAPASSGLPSSSSLRVPDDASPLNPLIAKASAAPPVTILRAQNVFDLGASNFGNALADRRPVIEKILTFRDDSMRLGSNNKRLVEQLVGQFNPRTDVFSVIGCSMGPTRVKGGNAALALGRAGRVVEALRYAGVDDRKILDEGCWAGGGTVGDLPTRGVVLTLYRQG